MDSVEDIVSAIERRNLVKSHVDPDAQTVQSMPNRSTINDEVVKGEIEVEQSLSDETVKDDMVSNSSPTEPTDDITMLTIRFNKVLASMSLQHDKRILALESNIDTLGRDNDLLTEQLEARRVEIFRQDRQIRQYQDDLERLMNSNIDTDAQERLDAATQEMVKHDMQQLLNGYEGMVTSMRKEITQLKNREKRYLQREQILVQDAIRVESPLHTRSESSTTAIETSASPFKGSKPLTTSPVPSSPVPSVAGPHEASTPPPELPREVKQLHKQLKEARAEMKNINTLREAIIDMEMVTDHHSEVKDITSRLRRKGLIGPHARANEYVGSAERAWLNSLREGHGAPSPAPSMKGRATSRQSQSYSHTHSHSHSHSQSRPHHHRSTSVTSINSVASMRSCVESPTGRDSPATSLSIDISPISKRGARSPSFTHGTNRTGFEETRVVWDLRDRLARLQGEHKFAIERMHKLEEECSSLMAKLQKQEGYEGIEMLEQEKRELERRCQSQLKRMEERRVFEREYYEHRIKEMEAVLDIGQEDAWSQERQKLEEQIEEKSRLVEVYQAAWQQRTDYAVPKSEASNASDGSLKPIQLKLAKVESHLRAKSMALSIAENEILTAQALSDQLAMDLSRLQSVMEQKSRHWQIEKQALLRHAAGPAARDDGHQSRLVVALLQMQVELERERQLRRAVQSELPVTDESKQAIVNRLLKMEDENERLQRRIDGLVELRAQLSNTVEEKSEPLDAAVI